MQKAESLQGKWRNVGFSLTALLIVVADQLSKIWIRSYPEERAIFEAGFFRIFHTHNTGAAFGLFQGHSFALTIVALVGIAVILLYALFIYRRFPILDNRLGRLALGLILGGAVGNLIDRLHLGYVTDFIDFGVWPAFNIADSAVTVGVIIIAYSLLPLARTEKH
ncbi:Lipoprotein signal peptidase [subsurface metagenome]